MVHGTVLYGIPFHGT